MGKGRNDPGCAKGRAGMDLGDFEYLETEEGIGLADVQLPGEVLQELEQHQQQLLEEGLLGDPETLPALDQFSPEHQQRLEQELERLRESVELGAQLSQATYQMDPGGWRNRGGFHRPGKLPYGLTDAQLYQVITTVQNKLAARYLGGESLSDDNRALATGNVSWLLEEAMMQHCSPPLTRNRYHNGYPDMLTLQQDESGQWEPMYRWERARPKPGQNKIEPNAAANARNGVEVKAHCVGGPGDPDPSAEELMNFAAHAPHQGHHLVVAYALRDPTPANPCPIRILAVSLPYVLEEDVRRKSSSSPGVTTSVEVLPQGRDEMQARLLYVDPQLHGENELLLALPQGHQRRRPLQPRSTVDPSEYKRRGQAAKV